jgi:hypothetical protein
MDRPDLLKLVKNEVVLVEETTTVIANPDGSGGIEIVTQRVDEKPIQGTLTFKDEEWENVEPKILEVAEQARGPAHQHLREALAPRATMVYETDTMKVTWGLNGVGESVTPVSTVFVRSGRTSDWTRLDGAQSFSFSLDVNAPLPTVHLTMVPL